VCYSADMFTKASPIKLTKNQQERLEFLSGSGQTPQKVALRARIVLLSSSGLANHSIAKQLGICRPTVLLTRRKFEQNGVQGLLKDAARPGRNKLLSADKEAQILKTTLEENPRAATHWSIRTLAKHLGVSYSTVQRVWQKHNLQPHRIKTFKLSRDKNFVEKLRDVVGLYMRPPSKALVFSVDEKSQIQALDRTQPGLPLKKGRCGTMTHDYKRNGTTTLFAALNMLDGSVIGECMNQHRAKEFLKFLSIIDKKTPPDLDLHLILDNYGTHKTPKVKAWLKKHPRFHFHFIPTSSSWLNMVERWFRNITDKAIRRGAFKSVQQLVDVITEYLDAHNSNPKIFTWTKDADTILAKVAHCKEALESLH
jgi:transposase